MTRRAWLPNLALPVPRPIHRLTQHVIDESDLPMPNVVAALARSRRGRGQLDLVVMPDRLS